MNRSSNGDAYSYSSKNLDIENLVEGSNTYSNIHSGGTLALKYIDGGFIGHIMAHYPVGLLQTLYSDQNIVFRDIVWESDCKYM